MADSDVSIDAAPVRLRELCAIFLLSGSMLGIQIGWTRIFSFMIWYHFAFLVISLAMLGFTAGGLMLQARPSLLARPLGGIAFVTSLVFSLGTALTLLIVCNLPFDGGVLDSPRNFALFLAMIVLITGGFLAAGAFVASFVAKRPASVSRVYAANMVGSGAGCAAAVWLLNENLPVTAVLAFALLGLVAAVALLPSLARRRGPTLWVFVGAVLLTLGLLISRDPLAEPFYLRSTKPFPALDKERILLRLSNSLSTIDMFEPGDLTGLWGLSDERFFADHPGGNVPERIGFCIDGWALTFSYKSAREITDEPVFDYLPSTIAYDAIAPQTALVIGAGGGIDVICAKRRGVREVTAVEINGITMDLAANGLAEYNGGIFHRDGVERAVAEGRSFVSSAGERRWDLIQLSGVDTLAASQAGAFTLAESYLYTIEAFESYLRHLGPGGVLTLTRWMFDPPRHSLRVITIADEALRKLGVRDTRSHIMLIADTRRRFGVFLISPAPFSPEQSERVLAASRERGFIPLALPHRQIETKPNVYERLLATRDKAQFVREYPFDIPATTDDRPFFFEHSKWHNVWSYRDYILDRFNGHLILLVTTLVVALLGVVFILLPSRFAKRHAAALPGDRAALAFFACLGIGYALIEMVLVQKLTLYLGNPVYALALVLSGMLTFSGLGSLLAPRVSENSPRSVVVVASAVAISLLLYRFVLTPVLSATLSQPLTLRIALALALLAPPTFLMGIPFPSAVALLGEERRGLVLRGWVMNGYFAVLGACVAMIASISFGFGVVLMIGAVLYAAASFAWSRSLRERSRLPAGASAGLP